MSNVSNTQDIIDSRDIMERIEELETEKKDLEEAIDEKEEEFENKFSDLEYAQKELDEAEKELADCDEEDKELVSVLEETQKTSYEEFEKAQREYDIAKDELKTVKDELENWEEDNQEELDSLIKLNEDGEGFPDWSYGSTLIHEDYFETYAQKLASELDLVSDTDKWPYTCIDWEQAADELKNDYSIIDYNGQSYFIRC